MPYRTPYGTYVYVCIYWYIHICLWQRQAIKGNARGTREISPLCQTNSWCSASVLSVRSNREPEITYLFSFSAAFSFSFFVTDTARVFSGQEGLCCYRSAALFHYFSELLALGSHYIWSDSNGAGDSQSVVKSSDLSQGKVFQCSDYKRYQQSNLHRASLTCWGWSLQQVRGKAQQLTRPWELPK